MIETASKNRLQFVHCDKFFATREEAKEYLYSDAEGRESNLKMGIKSTRPALYGEPMVLRYGDKGDPNILLAIGSVGEGSVSNSNRVFLIDFAEIKESIADLGKASSLNVEDSETIAFSLDKTSDGMTLSADVKVCKGIKDEYHHILPNHLTVPYDDGLFLNVDIEYKEEESELSLMVNGEPVRTLKLPEEDYLLTEGNHYDVTDEAIHLFTNTGREITIPMHQAIDEWTVLTPDDTKTPIVLTRTRVGKGASDEWHSVLSADVRLYDDDTVNNILKKTENGKYLYVDGKANNIQYVDKFGKYDDTVNSIITVQEALDNAKVGVSTLEDNIISAKNNGLYANVDVTYNKSENKLYFKKTSTNGELITASYELASLTIAERITYDSTTNELLVYYTSGSSDIKIVKIPLTEVFKEFTVDNSNSTVTLEYNYSDIIGSNVLKANLNVSTLNDNILVNQGHSLYVKGTADNIAYQETNVKRALDDLRSELDAEINSREDKTSDLTKTLNDTIEKLDDEIARSSEYDEALSAYSHTLRVDLEDEKNNRLTSEHAIDDTIKAVSGDLKTLILDTQVTSNSQDETLKGLIDSVSAKLSEEETKREEDDTTLSNRLDNLGDSLTELSEKTVTSVELVKRNDLLYTLKSNDKEIGDIVIPNDNYLDSVEYDEKNTELVFTYTVGGNTEVKKVNIGALVDTYVGSSTIAIVDNKEDGTKEISLKLVDHEKYLTIEDGGLSTVGIDAAIASAVSEVANSASDLEERVENAENAIKLISTGNELDEGSLAHTLKKAKDYADTLKEDVDASVNELDEAINDKADGLVAKLAKETSERLQNDATLLSTISSVDTKASDNTESINDLNTKLNSLSGVTVTSVEVKPDPFNHLLYYLYVNGVRQDSSLINIPEDQFLKTVDYDDLRKELKFSFITEKEHDKDIAIPIGDLVDTYTHGDGLSETGNKFSVLVDPLSQKYLEVSSAGVKIVNIDEALSRKTDSATTLALEARVKTAEDTLNTVTSNDDRLIGSIANAIKQSEDKSKELDEKLSEELNGKIADLTSGSSSLNEALEEEVKTREEADNNLQSKIDGANTLIEKNIDDISDLTKALEELSGKSAVGETIKLVNNNNGDNPLRYDLFVGNDNHGTIIIPQDKFLSDVTYDKDTKKLKFEFEKSKDDASQREPIEISLFDLVNTYTAESGVTLSSDNVFSVVVNEDTEKYLTNSKEGLKLSGIDAALATKANVGDSYTKDESDAKYLVNNDISNLATKDELEAEVTTLQDKDKDLKDELDKKLEKVELRQEGDLSYAVYADGVNVGAFTIPKDQFLKGVEYFKASQTLRFTFETTTGVKTADIEVGDLVDIYTNGNGLTLTDNVFAVKKDPSSEKYLTISEDGVKVSGIDEALSLKANATDVPDVSGFATKASLDSEKQRAEAAEKANADNIATIMGSVDTEGSIKNALTNAKNYTDSAVASERQRAEGVEKTINDALETINGNSATEGSIKNALTSANTYTDNAIASEKQRAEAAEKANADNIATIMGSVDTEGSIKYSAKETLDNAKKYTDDEISKLVDTKYTASSGLALSVDNQFSVKISEADEGYLSSTLDGIKVTGIDNKFSVVNQTLATKANVGDSYTKDETDAKYLVNNDISNLATKDELEAEVTTLQDKDTELEGKIDAKVSDVTLRKEGDLTYVLVVDGKDVDTTINIPKDQFLKGVEYFKASQTLRFTFETTTGVKTADIEVGDLVDIYTNGEGLVLSDNKFSINIDSTSENFLSVSDKGLKLSGVANYVGTEVSNAVKALDAKINTKADTSVSYTKAESDEKFVSEATLKRDGDSLRYYLEVDGVNKGEIIIPTDKFIKACDVVRTNNGDKLVLTYADNTTYETSLNRFGDGLSEGVDGAVKVILNNECEPYLTVSNEGLMLSGVSTSIETAKNDAVNESKTYTDTKISEVDTTVNTLTGKVNANSEAIGKLNGYADQEGSVANAVKNALDAAKGYTDTQLQSLTGETNEVATELSKTKLDIERNAANINTLSATTTTNSNDIGALSDKLNSFSSSTVTDVQLLQSGLTTLTEVANGNKTNISELDNRLDADEATLATLTESASNLSSSLASVRTDVEANKKSVGEMKPVLDNAVSNITTLTTKHEALDEKVDKVSETLSGITENAKDINTLDSRLTVEENKTAENADAIKDIKNDIKDIQKDNNTQDGRLDVLENSLTKETTTFVDTNNVEFNVIKSDEGKSVSASVKVSSDSDNVIVNHDGLYVKNTSFNYDETNNTITFADNDGNVEVFKLNSVETIKEAHFDGNTDELVFIVSLEGETTNEIRVGVSKFFKGIKGGSDDSHNVVVDTTVDEKGATAITANLDVSNIIYNGENSTVTLKKLSSTDNRVTAIVNISDLPTNALISDDNSLYVSNNAADYYLGNKKLGAAIDDLAKDLRDEINDGDNSVRDEFKEADAKVREDLGKTLTEQANDIKDLQTTVNSHGERIASLEKAAEINEATVVENRERIVNLERDRDVISGDVETLKELVGDGFTNAEGQVVSLREKVIELENENTILKERVKVLEDILIDNEHGFDKVWEKLDYLLNAVKLYDASDSDEGVFEFVEPNENNEGKTGIKFLLDTTDLDYNPNGF